MPDPISPAKLNNILVADVMANPHNPRRLFDEEPMRVLKESIQRLGVLVPVTVYAPRHETTRPYVLLDGERRWRCAVELQRDTIPAIIVEEPDETQNILTMFHIHNVREGWQLMPTALKVQALMQRLDETSERALSELTKLSISQVRRCKILLSYPPTFQNMMLAPKSERMKSDFFIELDRLRKISLTENLAPWVTRGDEASIELVLRKYLDEVIGGVLEFRKIAEIWRVSRDDVILRERFIAELERFLSTETMGLDEFKVEGAVYAKDAKEVKRSALRLLGQINDLEPEAIAFDPETIDALKELIHILSNKLEEGLLLSARESSALGS